MKKYFCKGNSQRPCKVICLAKANTWHYAATNLKEISAEFLLEETQLWFNCCTKPGVWRVVPEVSAHLWIRTHFGRRSVLSHKRDVLWKRNLPLCAGLRGTRTKMSLLSVIWNRWLYDEDTSYFRCIQNKWCKTFNVLLRLLFLSRIML